MQPCASVTPKYVTGELLAGCQNTSQVAREDPVLGCCALWHRKQQRVPPWGPNTKHSRGVIFSTIRSADRGGRLAWAVPCLAALSPQATALTLPQSRPTSGLQKG
ncbi:hypothetical protein TREES_T100003909 [Tupaia chinensis]|uniref:Uncharacterized protein n=1 Tax=Tupaia chinensis TaxID=246437 RepID=L9KZ97_TUPCH|nr:hypothetical protein TREES_T100003909 [Tupaia chinensis]